MIERGLPCLIFGDVVIQSYPLGAYVIVYSSNGNAISIDRVNPKVEYKAPLDELRKKIDPANIDAICEGMFDGVEDVLEASYPGGIKRARRELAAWFRAIADEDKKKLDPWPIDTRLAEVIYPELPENYTRHYKK